MIPDGVTCTCPRCGAPNALDWFPLIQNLTAYGHELTFGSYGIDYLDAAAVGKIFEFIDPTVFLSGVCRSCGQVVIYKGLDLVYPIAKGISAVDCMPKDAKKIFKEAQSIINLSPRAACAMLRICVERMVNASEAKGGNLAAKINSLNLPPKMTKLAHACRLVGNDAVHSNVIDFSVGSDEAQAVSGALSRFANRLAEELFGMAEEADEWTAKIEAARPKKQ